MKDVAKAAGVSLSAVSRVLNNSGYISDDKRETIEKVIRKLDYRPNVIARSLVKNKTKTIGLCLPYLNSPFISSLMEGIEAKSEKYGYDVFMSHTRDNPDAERNAMFRMLDRQIDGIIVVPVVGDRHYFEEIIELTPTMILLRKPKDITRNLICAADYQAAKRSFSLLLENGHRDIGIIGGPLTVSTIRERWRAIKELLRKHRLKLPPERIVETPFSYQDSYTAAKGMLTQKNPPTAIYVMHYWASTALMRLLHEMRIKLPEDLSVVTYESFEDWNLMSPFHIATNIFPAVKIGEAAVTRLHELISGNKLFMDENMEIEQSFYPFDSVKDIRPASRGR